MSETVFHTWDCMFTCQPTQSIGEAVARVFLVVVTVAMIWGGAVLRSRATGAA